MEVLSNKDCVRVTKEGSWVYKTQSKFLTDNEIYCLKLMYPSGYVPFAEQVSNAVIRLEYIHDMPVTDFDVLNYHFSRVLKALRDAGIRHGDLTKPNVLIRDNHPYLIDFATARLFNDPRLDKRRGGDEKWLRELFERLQNGLL